MVCFILLLLERKLLHLITNLSLLIYSFGKFNIFKRINKITREYVDRNSYYLLNVIIV